MMKFGKKILLLTAFVVFSSCKMTGSSKHSVTPLAITDEVIVGINQMINTQFIDSPVRGLNAVSEDGTKTITGAGGSFSCMTGQIVTFQLGTLSIGKAVCSDRMFITEIVKGNLKKAIGIGSVIQTLGGTDEAELDVSTYSGQDLTLLQPAIDVYLNGDGSVTSLGVLLTAFQVAGLPGFDTAAADPQGAYDKSRAHIAKSFTLYTNMPAWTITNGPSVTFVGQLTLDTQNSNASDCAQLVELSSAIEFNVDLGYYSFRYQAIQSVMASDGSTKRILHSSDGSLVEVTDVNQKPDYKAAKFENAFVLTGNNLTSNYSATFQSKEINFVNSLVFEGQDIAALTAKGSLGYMTFDETQKKVLGCLYQVSLPGAPAPVTP